MKAIGFKVEESLAAKIAKGYKSLNQGANSAVSNWHKVRTLAIAEIKLAVDPLDLRTLSCLSLPKECTVKLFKLILNDYKLSAGTNKFLETCNDIVILALIDLILTNGIEDII